MIIDLEVLLATITLFEELMSLSEVGVLNRGKKLTEPNRVMGRVDDVFLRLQDNKVFNLNQEF